MYFFVIQSFNAVPTPPQVRIWFLLLVIIPVTLGIYPIDHTLSILVFYFLLFTISGLNTGVSGTQTIRFRPPLIFTKSHVDLAVDILDNAINKLKKN